MQEPCVANAEFFMAFEGRIMDISDILTSDYVFFDLHCEKKKDLFDRIAEAFVEHGAISNAKDAVDLLIAREKLMSTGIGNGIAVPHAFLPGMEKSILAIGFIPEGMEFKALDNKPVHTVFLLLGAPASQSAHLRILARLSRLIASTDFMEKLHSLNAPEAVVQMIVAEEERSRLDRPRAK